jgi:hypothetical protein
MELVFSIAAKVFSLVTQLLKNPFVEVTGRQAGVGNIDNTVFRIGEFMGKSSQNSGLADAALAGQNSEELVFRRVF